MATDTAPGASSTRSDTSGVALGGRGSNDARLTTETKAGPKTTEFIAFLVVLAGILIAGLVVDQADEGGLGARQVWLYVTILTVGYMISRGLAKAGSRDPYWRGGTNQKQGDDGR